jgi:hypothetical protein
MSKSTPTFFQLIVRVSRDPSTVCLGGSLRASVLCVLEHVDN